MDAVRRHARSTTSGTDGDKCLFVRYHPNKTARCSVELATGRFVLDSLDSVVLKQNEEKQAAFDRVEKALNTDLTRLAVDAFLFLRCQVDMEGYRPRLPIFLDCAFAFKDNGRI